MSKKVALESKMRDAAFKLSSSTSKRASAKADQYTDANAKVEAAHKELLKVSERAATVDRRLLEHRAAVLAHTVRGIEERARANQAAEAGDSSDGTAATTISGELSPVSTAPTSLSVSSRSKFEGPHLFAGHSDAIVPALPRSLPTWKEIEALQEQLTAATEAAEVARQQASEYMRQLSTAGIEKVEVESRASLEVQKSEETIAQLERDLEQMRGLESSLEELRAAKAEIEREQASLVLTLRQRSEAVAALRASSGPGGRSYSVSRSGDSWDDDFTALRDELLQARQANASSSRQSSEELENGRSTLADVARSLNISLPGSVSTIPALAAALAAHVGGLQMRLEEHSRTQSGWDAERLRLENELKRGMDAQQRLLTDVEEARRDREELRTQLRVSFQLLDHDIWHY